MHYLLFIRHLKKTLLISSLMCLFITTYANDNSSIYTNEDLLYSKYRWAIDNTKAYPEESFAILEESYSYFREKKDTVEIINCLTGMADIARDKVEYGLQHKYLTQALHYAQSNQRHQAMAMVHRKLARLYTHFGMNTPSKIHLEQALLHSKTMYDKGESYAIQLNVSYQNMAAASRRQDKYHLALRYLDSCIMTEDVLKAIPWFRSNFANEKAANLIGINELQKAEFYIQEALDHDDLRSNDTWIRTNELNAEIALKRKQYTKAEAYYKETLKPKHWSNNINSRKAAIDEAIAHLYRDQKKYYLAYKHLEAAKAVEDSIGILQRQMSSDIFKINDSYFDALQEKELTIEQKDDIIKSNASTQLRLQIIIGLLILLIIAFIFLISMRLRLRKTITEKKHTELEAQLSREHNKRELDLKNQELASFALRLIDKESNVKELVETIKEISPDNHRQLESKYLQGNQKLWEEFNLRFTEVNKGFYERLIKRFPELSRTEQKHCALIKLNFSTKEMAQILNVEGHTINMSRSRIRKKMNLDRTQSLSSFVSSL